MTGGQARKVTRHAFVRLERKELRARIEAIKSIPCCDCKQTFDPVCMDFDHRPGEQKIACVATMVHGLRDWDRIMAEISKCDVVCANCHRLRTKTRGQHFSLAVEQRMVAVRRAQIALPFDREMR